MEQDVVVAVAFRWPSPPTPNHFTGRDERPGRISVDHRIAREGPLPMEKLEALLQARLKDETR